METGEREDRRSEEVQVSRGIDQQTGKCHKPCAAPDRERVEAVCADQGSKVLAGRERQ